ncbi:hypothetical protein [Sphingomonas sanxanigenens]|uniref:Uncharacterized protein n=1 Tax=Sphingomonas sanxanigenens DSM 19645 = NX02 TaxID=1123269 RepID=W0A377_9SPHN|nr:hypothetical protein [Sphingomonas sanxanigenens]AHE52404.1 hypothetical protein NX02_03250 [Sphingomonas sanxanigenens DSM 19645 = NX02]
MAAMTVVDHAPHHWFLLEQDGHYYLDVNCNHGAVGYSWLIALDAAECRAWRSDGRAAIDRLATAIDHSAPAAQASGSPYAARDLSAALGRRVSQAVAARRGRPTG